MRDRPASKKIKQSRADMFAARVARTIRVAFEDGDIASKFGLEGPMRAAIRADLCRQGWTWQESDQTAREVLHRAFRMLNAQRPCWDEGQLEWTKEAGTLIERVTCANCHKPLPEGRPKFCSSLCKSAHYNRVGAMKAANEDRAIHMAIWHRLT